MLDARERAALKREIEQEVDAQLSKCSLEGTSATGLRERLLASISDTVNSHFDRKAGLAPLHPVIFCE